MRRLVVSVITSLDGYHEGPGGDVLALPFDAGFSAYNLGRLRRASTLLLGRTSFEGFLAHWPAVADDEAADPVEREISRRNTALEKVVVSDTLTPDRTGAWAGTTRVVPRAAAAAEVARLKTADDDGDVLVFGSATTWAPLLRAGLVDELHVMVGPALLGAGTPVHAGPPVALRLLEARTLPGSQLVLHRYDATGVAPS